MDSEEELIKNALADFGDDAAELARLTVMDVDSFVAEIETAISAGDAAAAGLSAHALKSVLRQAGAAAAADAAFRMEKAGKAGDLSACAGLRADLKTRAAAARQYLAAFVKAA